MSQRQTQSLVSFTDVRRLLGDEAAASVKSHLKTSSGERVAQASFSRASESAVSVEMLAAMRRWT